MTVGLLHIAIHIFDSHSLKEKRAVLQPLIHQLRSRFSVSVAEVDDHDLWQSSHIACVTVSRDKAPVDQAFQAIQAFLENDGDTHGYEVVESRVEYL